MIYIRLHQVGNEEIEDKTSWMQAGICRMQAEKLGKFRKNSEIFARMGKFSLCMEILLHSEFSLC